MGKVFRFPQRKRRRSRSAVPRRTWHGAHREQALLRAGRVRLADLRISRAELIATLLAGLAVGLAVAIFFWWQSAHNEPLSLHSRSAGPAQWVIADLDTGSPAPVPTGKGNGDRAAPAQEGSIQFGSCHIGGGINCVVDGDTIWMDGVKIRIADIDTPETHPPRCAAEADLGNRATQRLQDLLNAGPVTLEAIDRDEDRYGRKLRRIVRGGKSLGDILVAEGLARPYRGGPRSGWCD